MIEQYTAPQSIEEAARVMQAGQVTILAGGTDLMPQSESGKLQLGSTLMNIRRVDGISSVSIDKNRVRIGALTTVTEILESEELRAITPVLAHAADCFASAQLRNAATIGGNLCNASPAGDMIIPLLLLDAEVVLASWSEGIVTERRLPVAEFFAGPGETRRRTDELLTAIELAVPQPGFVARFRKSGPRPALEISTVSVGIAGVLEDGALLAARIALGAAAPMPMRATKTEALIEGRYLDADLIDRAADSAAEEATPIDDVRASAWYRTHLIRVFTRRLLADVNASSD